MAASRFSQSATFDVPASFAFDFLADPSTASIIDPAVGEYAPDELPMRVGTRNRIRMRMAGVPVRAESVVREWEPGKRMVMESVKPTRPVRVTAVHEFTDEGHDRCRYTWTIVAEPVGVLGRIVGPLFIRLARRNAVAQQRRFRHEVERRWKSAER